MSYLDTRQQAFIPFGAKISTDNAALDGTTSGLTFKFADKPAAAVAVNPEWNVGEVIFEGSDAANEVCNYKIWAWRENGPAKLVAYGAVTLGAAITGDTNGFYADTITVTAATWITTVKVSDVAADRVASLAFDLCGYKWVYCEIDITTAATITPRISGY